MGFIRNNEPRQYFDGESNVYLYPGGRRNEEGSHIYGTPSEMREIDLAEVALRVIERTGLDDDTFDEVVEAVTEHYPQEFGGSGQRHNDT